MALQELAQNNPDDVTVMSSEFSQAWNVNFFFFDRKPALQTGGVVFERRRCLPG